MPKTGRNDPCPCGSGQKYKRCCLQKDQAAEQAARAAEQAALTAKQPERPATQTTTERRAHLERLRAAFEEAQALTAASNAVIDLINTGKLDEAERAARELLLDYPDVHDGYDRLGMVYEARGENKQAADCYRLCLDFLRAHAEDYEPDFETTYQSLIAKLDPPPTAG